MADEVRPVRGVAGFIPTFTYELGGEHVVFVKKSDIEDMLATDEHERDKALVGRKLVIEANERLVAKLNLATPLANNEAQSLVRSYGVPAGGEWYSVNLKIEGWAPDVAEDLARAIAWLEATGGIEREGDLVKLR